MTDFLLAVISFIIVLGPLILIHEFGHFIALRLTGVTVLEFGIGFPPRAAKLFERNGTEYTLNWLPIGGFVRPLGEDFVKPVGEKATEKERAAFLKRTEVEARQMEAVRKAGRKTKSLMEATPWQRIFFLVAGAGANFIGAFAILVIAALLGQPAPAVVVLGTAPKSPAAAAQVQNYDLLLAIDSKPIKGSKEVEPLLNAAAKKPVTLTLKRDGKVIQVKLEPATQSFEAAAGVSVKLIAKRSPAAEVLQLGDTIRQAAVKDESDKPLTTPTTENLKKYVENNAGKLIVLTVERAGVTQEIEITPRTNPPRDEGPLGVVIEPVTYDTHFGLGVGDHDSAQIVPANLSDAISGGMRQTLDTVGRVAMAPIEIIRGVLPAEQARPVSIVGISQIGAEFLGRSLQERQPYPILNFAAVISIALGVTNLLPLPALDGGRILFVIIELIRGKPIDQEREGMVHLIGLMLLLGLTAIIILNDLINPISIPR